MTFLIRVVVNALALGAAAWLLDDIRVGGDTEKQLLTLLAVPVFYSLFEDAAHSAAWGRVARRWERATAGVGRMLGRRQRAHP